MSGRWTHSNTDCHICSHRGLVLSTAVPGFQVTSDCRPRPSTGVIGVCPACGHVQKPVDDVFMENAARIYASYQVYAQSGGKEPKVFGHDTGAVVTRSEKIFHWLMERIDLPNQGRMLDYGCGNGRLLKTFAELRPEWRLFGLDLNPDQREAVTSIPGVVDFFDHENADLPGELDLITIMHCLEHIPHPQDLLQKLRQKLSADGVMLIQTPNWVDNPFDLMIADHCSHFSAETVYSFLVRHGFRMVTSSDRVVPKELTVVIAPCPGGTSHSVVKPAIGAEMEMVDRTLSWLNQCIDTGRHLSSEGPLGILGTSIGGAWLFGALEKEVAFFVDEDRDCIGRLFLRKPVFPPEESPHSGQVLIGLPHPIARKIAGRLNVHQTRFHPPPPFPSKTAGHEELLNNEYAL